MIGSQRKNQSKSGKVILLGENEERQAACRDSFAGPVKMVP